MDDAGQRLAGGTGGVHAALHVSHAGAHGFDGFACALLDGADGLVDFFGCRAGSLGQAAHLARNYGETAAMLACARRFDGGVESKEVCLAGDLVDDADDSADGIAGAAQFLDPGRGLLVGY